MKYKIKTKIKNLPLLNKYFYCKQLYKHYKNENSKINLTQFILTHFLDVNIFSKNQPKVDQIVKLIEKVDIQPLNSKSFYYSIDPYKKLELNYQILDNYSIDYSWVIKASFIEIISLMNKNSKFGINILSIINALEEYVKRLRRNKKVLEKYLYNISEIESLFSCSAIHFHEAIQRILFVNQWLWQTGHKHNGFGHLDWILYDLYRKDLDSGYITKKDAISYLKDFFYVLHDKCWFKSTMLLGDTGQIIILGGLGENDEYRCNDLTYLFIEVSKELKLPDPKVLLRVSKTMPDNLLRLAMECIATGIGAPFLSNDDVVISSLIQFGYDKEDAYNYATSACWEPLIIGKSCDQNNIKTLNFCEPFIKFLNSDDFEKCQNIEQVKEKYYEYTCEYLNNFFSNLDKKIFEEDPILTLFNPEILKSGKDIVRGGAQYSNLGVTTVGMSTVVNSLLNIKHFVFEHKKYSLHDLNEIRKKNFECHDNLRKLLDTGFGNFGNDVEETINLTNEIMQQISNEFEKHHTKLGGKYKYGLSSPNYIVDSKNMSATFDGRKAGQAFGVHISGKNGLSPTELISFASQLDYNGNRINGNVIDFIISPGFIKNNIDKTIALIKGGIKQGFYQLQINVVDSHTLIAAQKNPEKFPNLVVRVWGFSAYFKDLPKDYQDNLIKRAFEAEIMT